jgi:hypothetical protein
MSLARSSLDDLECVSRDHSKGKRSFIPGMTLDGRAQEATADRQGGSLKKNAGKTPGDFANSFKAIEVSPPSNSGKRWTPQDIHELKLLARANIPVDLIACELQRTKKSVRTIAKREGIALWSAGKRSLLRFWCKLEKLALWR